MDGSPPDILSPRQDEKREMNEKHSSDEMHSSDDKSESLELDGIHDGLVFPTEEERATLRRVADKIPWNAYRKI